jgi:hypothetical protein
MLLAASAVLAVVLVSVAAIALRDDQTSGDGGGGAATVTTSPEVRLAEDWEQDDVYVVDCQGDGEGPCPDTSAFELYFALDCPAMPAVGGFGRSRVQAAEDTCSITLLDMPPVELTLPPVPLETDATFSAQVDTDSPPGGLIMEFGPTCNGERTNYAISFAPFDEEERNGERVITEVRGDLYVYPLSVQEDPTCGSQYHFGFIMRAAS